MIEFDADSHTYQLAGRAVPSVTEVLKVVEDLSHVDPQTLDQARQFGTDVHRAAELFVAGTLDTDDLDSDVKGCIDALERYLEDMGLEPVATEVIVYSTRHQYAGTMDLLAKDWSGYLVEVDYKTSLTRPRAVGPQTAAYEQAYHEMTGTPIEGGRCCLRLRSDGTYRADPLEDSADWLVFRSALNIWQFNHGF